MIIKTRGKQNQLLTLEDFLEFINIHKPSPLLIKFYNDHKNDELTLSNFKKLLNKIDINIEEKNKNSSIKKSKNEFLEMLIEKFGDKAKSYYDNYMTKLKSIIKSLNNPPMAYKKSTLFYYRIIEDNKIFYGLEIIDGIDDKLNSNLNLTILDIKWGDYFDLFYISQSILREFKHKRTAEIFKGYLFLEGFSEDVLNGNLPEYPLQKIEYMDKIKIGEI